MQFLKDVQEFFVTLASCGLLLTPLAMLVYALRQELKDLYERYLRQSRLARAIIAVCFSSAVVAGSIKPLLDAMDSDYAHEDYGHEMMLCSVRVLANTENLGNNTIDLGTSLLSTASASLSVSAGAQTLQSTTIANWTTHGAFEDWQTIDLPDGFAFPVGLTNLTRVTIMAYGEIRRDLKTPIEGNGHAGRVTLPFRVSCQPDETTVSYGLTSSNSFVIAWSNALSNRVAVASQWGSDVLVASDGTTNSTSDAMGTIASTSQWGSDVLVASEGTTNSTSDAMETIASTSQWGSDVLVASDGTTNSTSDAMGTIASTSEDAATNRLNAAIELFPSGAIATTITSDYPSEVPTTYSLLPTPLPSGFYGSGQDEAWVRGNFALFQSLDSSLTNVEQILDVGYATWLNDWVGVNEQNGHVKATLTIATLPDNGAPCYLVCGPYKMVVPAAGSYSFPIEVFTDYPARTYPEAVPITVAYDEGYTLDGTTSTTGEATSSSLQSETNPIVRNDPEFHITPSVIYVDETTTTNEPYVVSVWINAANFMQKTWFSSSGLTSLLWRSHTQAEIHDALVNDWVTFILQSQGHEISGELEIRLPSPYEDLCSFCNATDCPCFSCCYDGCPCHPNGTNVCIRVDAQHQ